ncbi:MAG TPA: ATP-binding protein [Actinomycetota bacterium]|jgi:signal transduction histidine kinase
MVRFKAFTWLTTAVAMGIAAWLLSNELTIFGDVAVGDHDANVETFIFWTVLLAASELLPVSLGFGAEVTMAFTVHLGIAIVFRSQPGIAMAIAGLAAVDIREFKGQLPLFKALFNRSVMMLSIGAASIPFAWAYADGDRTPYNILLIAAAAILYLVVNLNFVAAAVRLERGVPMTETFGLLIPKPYAGFALSYVLLAMLGVATALAYEEVPYGGWAVAAILIPLLFARLSIIGARTQQELAERIRKQQQELLVATEKVFEERERERNRIAEDIHDSSLQSLAAAAYGSGNALEFLEAGHIEKARAAMAGARDAVDGAIVTLRESLVDLRKSAVEEGGLMETVNKFVDQVGVLWGADVKVEGTVEHEPPVPVALAAFQIVQESLTNAVKHSEGSPIAVKIEEIDGMVHILVEDEGPGFDTSVEIGDDHHGMRLMKERAARVGGRIELDSKPGAGTRLEAILPAGVAQ